MLNSDIKVSIVFPEKLVIYHAGSGRVVFLAFLKLTTIFVCAFFCAVVVPSYVRAGKPYLETAGGKNIAAAQDPYRSASRIAIVNVRSGVLRYRAAIIRGLYYPAICPLRSSQSPGVRSPVSGDSRAIRQGHAAAGAAPSYDHELHHQTAAHNRDPPRAAASQATCWDLQLCQGYHQCGSSTGKRFQYPRQQSRRQGSMGMGCHQE
jgi:hypothetical protein